MKKGAAKLRWAGEGDAQRSVLRGWDLAELLERLTVNAVVATVLGSIQASSEIVESEGRQM